MRKKTMQWGLIGIVVVVVAFLVFIENPGTIFNQSAQPNNGATSEENGQPTGQESQDTYKFIGTWSGSSNQGHPATFTFNSDGTGSFPFSQSGSVSGMWSVSNSGTITTSWSGDSREFIYHFVDCCHLTLDDNSGETYTLAKG